MAGKGRGKRYKGVIRDPKQIKRLLQIRDLEEAIEKAYVYRSQANGRKELARWNDNIISLEEEYRGFTGEYYHPKYME